MSSDPEAQDFALEREANLLIYDQPGAFGFLRRVADATPDAVLIAVVDPSSRLGCRRWIDIDCWNDLDGVEVVYGAVEAALLDYRITIRRVFEEAQQTGWTRVRMANGRAVGREFTVPVSPGGYPPLIVRVPLPQRLATLGPDFTKADPWTNEPAVADYRRGELPAADGVWEYRLPERSLT